MAILDAVKVSGTSRTTAVTASADGGSRPKPGPLFKQAWTARGRCAKLIDAPARSSPPAAKESAWKEDIKDGVRDPAEGDGTQTLYVGLHSLLEEILLKLINCSPNEKMTSGVSTSTWKAQSGWEWEIKATSEWFR